MFLLIFCPPKSKCLYFKETKQMLPMFCLLASLISCSNVFGQYDSTWNTRKRSREEVPGFLTKGEKVDTLEGLIFNIIERRRGRPFKATIEKGSILSYKGTLIRLRQNCEIKCEKTHWIYHVKVADSSIPIIYDLLPDALYMIDNSRSLGPFLGTCHGTIINLESLIFKVDYTAKIYNNDFIKMMLVRFNNTRLEDSVNFNGEFQNGRIFCTILAGYYLKTGVDYEILKTPHMPIFVINEPVVEYTIVKQAS